MSNSEFSLISSYLVPFQYATDSRGSRDPSFFNRFNDGNFQEATRLIELKLHLVPASSLPQNFVFVKPRKSSKSAKYPNLYFSGTSKGIVQGNESTVHGSVHMGDDGVLRWRFVSRVPLFPVRHMHRSHLSWD